MGQTVQASEHHLMQIAADLRARMSEIKGLRAAIQSAETASSSRRSVQSRRGPALHSASIGGTV